MLHPCCVCYNTDMNKQKLCTKCHQQLPLSSYYSNTYTSSGLYSWCKSCHNSYCTKKNTGYYCKRKKYFQERYQRSDKHQQSLQNRAQRASYAVIEHIQKSGVWYYLHRSNIEGYLSRFLRSRVPRFRGLGEYMQDVWNAYQGDPVKIHNYYVARAKVATRKPYNPDALCWFAGGIWTRSEQFAHVREKHQWQQRLAKLQLAEN